MYHITFSRPGAAEPYLILYGTPGAVPPEGAVSVTGGQCELLAGNYCGAGSIEVSAPFDFKAGDWARVYLDAWDDPDFVPDAPDNPTYLGEITGEPWAAGGRTISLRSLRDSVEKAAWTGFFEKPLKDYVLTVLSLCDLPPGVTAGEIADDLTTFWADTPFELLGDTMNTIVPAIENGTWGLNSRAQIGLSRPDTTVRYRFVQGEADTPPGDTSNYANSIRFPVKAPDGSESYFEGQDEEQVAARGAQWEVTTLPARIATPKTNPLLNLSADVTTHVLLAGQTVNFTSVKPAFQADWTGKLADTDITLKIGGTQAITTAQQSLIRLAFAAQYFEGGVNPYNANPIFVLDLGRSSFPNELPGGTNYGGTVIEGRFLPGGSAQTQPSPWAALQQAGGTQWDQRVKRSDDVNPGRVAYAPPILVNYIAPDGSVTMEVRYAQGFIDAWNALNQGPLPGLSVSNTAIIPDALWPGSATFNDLASITHQAQLGGQTIPLTLSMSLYGGRTTTGDYPAPWTPQDSAATLQTTAVPAVTGVTVTLPAPLSVFGGSAVQVKATGSGSSLKFNNTAALTVLADPPTGTLRWGYTGDLLRVTTLDFSGNVAALGAVSVEISDVSTLVNYGYGLLRHRTQPVRRWTATLNTLTRPDVRGKGLFETPSGDVALDVQRATLNLGSLNWTLECGTPLPRTPQEAIKDKVKEIKQLTRVAGGQSG